MPSSLCATMSAAPNPTLQVNHISTHQARRDAAILLVRHIDDRATRRPRESRSSLQNYRSLLTSSTPRRALSLNSCNSDHLYPQPLERTSSLQMLHHPPRRSRLRLRLLRIEVDRAREACRPRGRLSRHGGISLHSKDEIRYDICTVYPRCRPALHSSRKHVPFEHDATGVFAAPVGTKSTTILHTAASSTTATGFVYERRPPLRSLLPASTSWSRDFLPLTCSYGEYDSARVPFVVCL
ncbi:hypothetical protein R3P38DRAFT_3206266 [Favolaschia claudopus]|uniref:Uncharacterized protein n=1 Tax=Favolaschia claudopus TaxID=2862362 RepID=A0AAW0AL96_9AGAR